MPIMDGYKASQIISSKINNEHYVCTLILGYTALLGISEE